MSTSPRLLASVSRRVSSAVGLLLVAAVAWLGSGCNSTETNGIVAPPNTLLIKGIEPLNVNEANVSIPVNVRILALSSRNAFDEAVRDFDLLWRDPRSVLGDELLGSPITATVFPAGTQAQPRLLRFEPPLNPGTRYIALLALFHTDVYPGAEVQRYRVMTIEEAKRHVFVLTRARVDLESTP